MVRPAHSTPSEPQILIGRGRTASTGQVLRGQPRPQMPRLPELPLRGLTLGSSQELGKVVFSFVVAPLTSPFPELKGGVKGHLHGAPDTREIL